MAQWLELVFKLPLYQSFFYRNAAAVPKRSAKAAAVESTGTSIPMDCAAGAADGEESLAGRRAAVRFGSRKLVGFIVAEHETLPKSCPFVEADIKPIDRIIDAEPLFTDEQAALARWMSHFYICAEGIAQI